MYSYEYDGFGRLKKETENIQERIFETEMDYNDDSQLDYIKYPEDNFNIDIQYQNGYISTVSETDNIFRAISYNRGSTNRLLSGQRVNCYSWMTMLVLSPRHKSREYKTWSTSLMS